MSSPCDALPLFFSFHFYRPAAPQVEIFILFFNCYCLRPIYSFLFFPPVVGAQVEVIK